MAEPCRAVGASKATLYRHFGSKDGLVEAVLEARSDRVVHWLTEAVETAGPDPAAQLTALFEVLGAWYRQPGFRGRAIVNAATQRHTPPASTLAERHLAPTARWSPASPNGRAPPNPPSWDGSC
ncbi:TetR/AcrR family transcriptional regulator [Streptomyces sp. NPDC002276]